MNRPLLNVLDPQGSGALLSRLLAIADDAIIVTDDQQRIVLFNEGAGGIFGYDLPQVLGQPLHMLLPDEVRERHATHLRAFGLAQRAACLLYTSDAADE